MLDDREALVLLLRERVATNELGEPEDGVERRLEVVAHRRKEEAAHALSGLARLDRAALRGGELAEDAAERVDGLEQLGHPREARLVQDDRAAHDLGDAGATDLARGERDVRVEECRRARTEDRGEPHRGHREQDIRGESSGEARRPEAHQRGAGLERDRDLRLALVALTQDLAPFVRRDDLHVEAERRRRLDCLRTTGDVVGVAGAERLERSVGDVDRVLRARLLVERTRVGVREERRSERDERDGKSDGRDVALPQPPEDLAAESAQAVLGDTRRDELEGARDLCSHQDVGGERRGAHEREDEEHEGELRVHVDRLRAERGDQRGERDDAGEADVREREQRRRVVEREDMRWLAGGRLHGERSEERPHAMKHDHGEPRRERRREEPHRQDDGEGCLGRLRLEEEHPRNEDGAEEERDDVRPDLDREQPPEEPLCDRATEALRSRAERAHDAPVGRVGPPATR